MNTRRFAITSAVLAPVTAGGYALLCSLTDTWAEAPPSAHAAALALCVIGGLIIAIVASSET